MHATKQMIFKGVLVFVSLCSAWSCRTTEEGPNPTETLSTNIQAKWEIADPASSFKSMEFNKSAQAIVVPKTGLPASFYYKVLDAKTVDIKNFGKMAVESLNGADFKFTFTPNGSTSAQSLLGKKAASTTGTNSGTDILCRTWKVNSLTMTSPAAYNVNFDTVGTVLVTFTNTGTYFVQGQVIFDLNSGDSTTLSFDSTANMMSWWKWTGPTGSQICYSHDTSVFDCDSVNTVTFTTLTNNSLVVNQQGLLESTTYLTPYTLGGRMAVDKPRKGKLKHPLPAFLVGK